MPSAKSELAPCDQAEGKFSDESMAWIASSSTINLSLYPLSFSEQPGHLFERESNVLHPQKITKSIHLSVNPTFYIPNITKSIYLSVNLTFYSSNITKSIYLSVVIYKIE